MLNPGSNNALGTESCVRLRGNKINDADCFQESKAGISGLCDSHSNGPAVHMDNGPKFKHRLSISWTESDAGPRLSFLNGFLTMDPLDRPPQALRLKDVFERRTIIIY